MVTSTTPDPLRSYQVEERIPGLLDRLTQQSQALMTLATHLQQVTGQEGGHTSTVMDTARFLQHMVDKPWIIPSVLGEYRDAIGNLGAWVIDARNQPLQIDYIVVAFPGMELPKAAPSLPETVAHEAKSFAASFVHDYSGVLDIQVEENTCEDSLEEIEV